MNGKDFPAVRMDFTGFGFLKREVNEWVHEYIIEEPQNKVHMTANMILPGIEVYCTDYYTNVPSRTTSRRGWRPIEI